MSRLLFQDENSDSDVELKTNNDYATKYNTWRQKEEFNKLKTKYGPNGTEDSDNDSSSSSDDEELEIDGKFEKDFYKTLSCLKNRDPRIYNENVKFFDGKIEPTQKSKKERPMFLKDYERKVLLEKGGQFSDEEEEQQQPPPSSLTYVEEQERLKENLKNALENIDDNDCDGLGGLLKARKKTKEEKIKEEEDYEQWLAGQREHLDNQETESDLKPLKEFWSNPDLDEGEKFLRDFILKKRFLETEDENYIPTYDEILHDSDQDLSNDEENVEKQEEFEHKYNFRYEEPDQEFIKRYPRTVENSLRKKDDRRKIKRAEVKDRKLQEKKQKMEEIKQLKVMKRKEIEEKIQKLKEVTGNNDIRFDVEDIDGDFDPAAHDQRMQTLFNDDYYHEEEGDQKPEFPDLDEELEIEKWDRWNGEDATNDEEGNNEKTELHCEDDGFIMDCDYDPQAVQKELIENSGKRKKRKRRSKFAKAVSCPKPIFNPADKTFQEYVDEYYKLDCEDIIGDVPCRFKYRNVVPNDFGLTTEEILLAKDRELNKWCSLKKTVQHRPEHVEKYDVIAYQKKANNIDLKKKLLPSLFVEEDSKNDNENQEQSNQNKQENNNVSQLEESNPNKIITAEDTPTNTLKRKQPHQTETHGHIKKCKKVQGKRLNNLKKDNSDPVISDARLAAYGFNPKKFKNKLKYGKKK